MHCVLVRYSIVLEECSVSVFRDTELVLVQPTLCHTQGVAVNAWQFQAEVVSNRMWQARDSFRWQPNYHDMY